MLELLCICIEPGPPGQWGLAGGGVGVGKDLWKHWRQRGGNSRTDSGLTLTDISRAAAAADGTFDPDRSSEF